MSPMGYLHDSLKIESSNLNPLGDDCILPLMKPSAKMSKLKLDGRSINLVWNIVLEAVVVFL